jgi:hypothetical protein
VHSVNWAGLYECEDISWQGRTEPASVKFPKAFSNNLKNKVAYLAVIEINFPLLVPYGITKLANLAQGLLSARSFSTQLARKSP